MSADIWLIIFIGFIILNFAFSSILEYINDKNWKNEIPIELRDYYNKEQYLKAKNYKKARGKVSLISSCLSTSLTLLILSTGFYGYVSDYISEIYSSKFIHSGGFFLFFYLINMIVSIPISYYSTFIIEEEFGFNKTTLGTFFADIIKGILMSLLIGGLLLGAALFIYDYFSDGFWIWLWIGLSLFTIFISMFYTTLIVPIFNKLSPLENGTLKEKIENYSKGIGYSLKNIFIIDGSKRSSKANAYFSGLGPRKTIALFDTLVEKHTEEELVAVLAHEVGHYKKNHIKQGMFISIFQIGMMCYLFELCTKLPEITTALGAEIGAFHLGLIGFSLLFSPIGLILGIFGNILSRKNEFEADSYAKETYDGESLKLALKKLSVDSLTNLYPHPLYVFIHYSHPPLLERLKALG
jgi:STE24 endopeptidase